MQSCFSIIARLQMKSKIVLSGITKIISAMKNLIKDFDDYLLNRPEKVKTLLIQIRHTILKSTPGAEEVISYGMPAVKFYGLLVWYAANKNHIGFYPKASGIEHFKKELKPYKWAKGSVQFPYDKPLPLGLVSKIVKFRIKENLEKAKAKKVKPVAARKK